MELVNIFKLCLYGLTAFSAWMLGRAEGGWIPYVTFPVLAAAYAITEPRGGRTLPSGPANLIGMLAVAAAAWEFWSPDDQEAKLLSGAHLLVYATWIVMFQQKTYRLYWWVMALGVLQVAVASVLAPGPWYGFCLILYICAALCTMSIASLYQVQQQFAAGDAGWKWQTSHDLGGTAAVLVRPSVQFDESHSWLTRRFFGGLSLLVAMSLTVSALFFALTPRVWFGPRNMFGDEVSTSEANKRSVTGFARDVRLGEMGEILESVEPVLSMRCRDARTGDPLDLAVVAQRLGMSEPMLRGAVMTEYKDGRWIPERSDQLVKMGWIFNRAGFELEITIDATNDEVLFCVGSPEAVEIEGHTEDAYVQLSTGILTREVRPESRQRLSYKAYVAPISPEMAKLHAVPLPSGLLFHNVDVTYLRRNQLFDNRNLPRLDQLAQSKLLKLEQTLGRTPKVMEVCRDFEAYFLNADEFGYTLAQTIIDPEIDPVEDFLFNRKEGHCEYFASALTLMLRAVGIPARLVSGFKGAEQNTLRGSWVVQERHAHAWVEAWTEDNVWIMLDPTPGQARNEVVEEASNKLGFWGRFRASSSILWQDYVVNVNLRQQRDRVYEPVREFFRKLVAIVRRSSESWQSLWSTLADFVTHPSKWLSVTGGVVTFVILIILTTAIRGFWRLFLWWRSGGWSHWWLGSAQSEIVVAFYERFVKAAKKVGMQRRPTQTPQEFADSVSDHLSSVAIGAGIELLPGRVSSAFYRIRFGGETLPEGELELIESQLRRLEEALTPQHA